ncbi:MAG: hydantoinase B/oxoprolinase family protein [Clostridiales bacterium]|nr:hydantoinase B/oxoprolinase family protein [Clostridiales bacterium]MCF8023468.1 hydantoinase B/oxoprolinase family protein [Clostridiales bacterium]
MQINPVTLEVLRNALQSIAEEMGAVLTRTALSPNIKDRRDCSTAIYTTSGRLVAQAEHIPLHLGLMPDIVSAVLKKIPLENMEPGDAVIINDPYISGSHLPDICIIRPVYASGFPIALAANLAHHVDVGGCTPGSMSTMSRDIFHEGIRIPPLKIMHGGKLNDDLVNLLSNNVRTPEEMQGDIHAQVSAAHTGERRLQELARRHGINKLCHCMENIITYTERRMRSAINSLPPGEYQFEDYLEGDGISNMPLRIAAKIELIDGEMKVDFTGTAPQAAGPVNATPGVTKACVYYVSKAIADPELPGNHGITIPVHIFTPEGTLVNPVYPAPVAHANINTAQRITDVILGAFSRAVPERVTAAGTGSMNNFTIGGTGRESKFFSYVETYGGGQGAMLGQDGMDGVHVHMTNTRNTPVEVIENYYPLQVEKYCLRKDSGGSGKFRGGCGIERVIKVLSSEAGVSISAERSIYSPWGLHNGLNGMTSSCCIQKPGKQAEEYRPAKFTTIVPEGTIITLKTAGGGGCGKPEERENEKVKWDIKNGFVSPEKAKENY